MIGYGITLPVFPFYIERLALSGKATAASISVHVGVLTGLFAFMQFIFAPLWGKISDRKGRRIFILISLGGYALSMMLFGMGKNLATLYSARVIGGILSAALFPVANAYIADSMPENKRGQGLAWLGTSIGLGVVVGPLLGVLLSRMNWHYAIHFGYFSIDKLSVPFFVAAALALIALITAQFLLPETIHTQDKELLQKRDVVFDIYRPPWVLLILSLMSQFALSLFEGTFAIHAQRLLNFGPYQMGMVFMTCGFVMAVAQAGFVSRLMMHAGEKPLLPLGLSLMGSALILLMTTKSLPVILLFVVVLALGMAVLIPSLAVLVTKSSGRDFGTALGIQSSSNSLGQAFGPPIGGLLLNWSIHLPYLLTGISLLGAALLLWRNERIIKST